MTSSISAYHFSSPLLVFLGVWIAVSPFLVAGSRACNFPPSMVMGRDDPPWYSHVMQDGSRGVEYYIRRGVMEIHFTNGNQHHTRWKCVMAVGDKLLLKRQDHHANSYYKCAKFHMRSPSIVQLAWSDESKIFDIAHCDDHRLHIDPWPVVRYEGLESDYTQCPFNGGYDMKITDSQLGESGCNLMHKPMRMEVECVGGDGVIFDFTSTSCLPNIQMHPRQHTMCVASWQDGGYHVSVLRRHQDTRLWCLAVPVQRSTNVKAYLFSDLICRGESDRDSRLQPLNLLVTLKYFILDLYQRNFLSLCEDEYSECSSVTCNEYFKQECKKSCHACNGTSHAKKCMFPKTFMGSWFLKSPDDYRHIEMRESEMAIQGVGKFQCAAFPDSPLRKSGIYSTVSVYDNGCRPRYTCLKLQRLAPSVIRYSLSQSYAWPSVKENYGQTICEPDRFQADQEPIEDLYRSHTDSGKPIIANTPEPVSVNCNLSSVYTLSATLPEKFICTGTMATHCEDPTKIRVEFASCSGLIATNTDYRCLANFEGHYWERILLVQNVADDADAICFVFNQFKPNQAYAMEAGQCDKEAFNYARAKVRKPVLSLRFRKESEPCLPVAKSTLPPTVDDPREGGRIHSHDSRTLNSGRSSLLGNRTPADQGHAHRPVVVTLSPSDKPEGLHKSRTVGEAISQSKGGYGSNGSGDSPGDDVTACTANRWLVFILICISCFVSVLR